MKAKIFRELGPVVEYWDRSRRGWVRFGGSTFSTIEDAEVEIDRRKLERARVCL